MAIAYQSTAWNSNAPFNSTSLSWSHTTSWSDRLLIVSTYFEWTSTTIGVTYSGVAMSLISSIGNHYLYSLVAPATGANNVVITIGASRSLCGSSISFTWANQSSPVDTFWTNSGTIPVSSTQNTGLTLTTASANTIRVDSIAWQNGYYGTAWSGQTIRQFNSTTNDNVYDSTLAVAWIGSSTVNWSVTTGPGSSCTWNTVWAALKEVTATPSTNSNFLSFM